MEQSAAHARADHVSILRIIECGCDRGQLTNFLAVANRMVFGVVIGRRPRSG